MMVDAGQLDALCRAAAAILRRRFGAEVALTDPIVVREGGRNLVVRCRLATPAAGVASVIVKQLKGDTTLGFTDWACLRYLSESLGEGGLAPRFYGGDSSHGLFVMEDLGGSRSLQDVLMGDDPDAVRRALYALAVQYARLHAATIGTARRFEQACADVPQAGVPGRHEEARQWVSGLTRVRRWFDAADCVLPTGFDEICAEIARSYAEPGPFLAFTHGDPAPTNNHLAAGGGVRLLDFEYGGFRHALYDLTAWHVLCPLPEPMVQMMGRAYRAELAKGCRVAGDDEPYDRAWAVLCAYRALAMLSWIPRGALEENRSWVNDWTAREAVLAVTGRLHAATVGLADLAPLAEAAGGLERALRRRWPELRDADGLPRWPALQTA